MAAAMFDLKTSTAKLSTSAASLKEGGSLTTTVVTDNVKPGTVLFWAIKGVSSDDLAKGELTGSDTVNDKGTFSFSHVFKEDRLTEGNEKANIALFSDSSRTTSVAETSVEVLDSSTAPIATPAYKLSTSAASLKEGGSLTTTVVTDNVKPGTVLFWAIKGVSSDDLAKGELTGSDTVNDKGTFSFSHVFKEDRLTEGNEKANIALFSDSSRTTSVAETSVEVLDSSTAPIATPAYKLSTSAASLKEGGSLTTTVVTDNVKPGTVLFWAIKGVSSDDLAKGELTGSDTVNDKGTFSFSHVFKEDRLTEGNEKANIALFSDSSRTTSVAETSVEVLDSSTAPIATPAYKLSTSAASLKEGGSLTTTVVTDNVKPGTVLFWAIKGVSSDDLAKGELTGSDTVNDKGTFSFSHVFKEDRLTEGNEKANIALFSDSSRTTSVAETSVEVLDSSTAPIATPAYKLSTSAASLKEGGSLTTTVVTDNVKPGTVLFWAIKGVSSDDLAKGELTGSDTVNDKGTFSFSHVFKEDRNAEGSENLSIRLFTEKSMATAVAKASIAIIDGSDPTPSAAGFNSTPKELREGDILTLTGFSKNLKPGTKLYWNLNRQTSDATLKDFKILVPKPSALSTTVAKDGTFEIAIPSLQDKTKEKVEQFQVELFLNPLAKQATASTEAIRLIDATSANKPDLKVENQVIPARFSDKRIPIKNLIDFSSQNKESSFNFNNSKNGGYFEYLNKPYQGSELRSISTENLNKVFYVPKAPSGHYDVSNLKTIEFQSPTEILTQKEGLQTQKDGNTELITKEGSEKVRQRQDPFNPLTTLKKQSSPSFSDQISISVNTLNGTSTPVRANWITRGNWKPEIALLQSQFETGQGEKAETPITDILDIYDIDGDDITNIRLRDVSSGKQTGFFKYNKRTFQGTELPSLNEAELKRVIYHPGTGGINTIEVSASDALKGTSRTFKADLQTKKPAQTSLSKIKQTFDTADIGRHIPLTNLIGISTTKATDSNTYDLNLKSKSKQGEALGYFKLNGKRLQPKQLTGLNQDQVRKISFIPTNNKTRSTFSLKATDASGKTKTSSSPWNTTGNKKPILNVEPMQLPASKANTPISVSNLISADDDGDSISSYTLQSSKRQGSFQFKGKTYSNKALTVGAADLARVTYIPPKSGKSDQVRITASDGEKESKASLVNWSTSGSNKLGSLSRQFNLGINKEWKIGDFLGVQNEQSYSKFLGLDKTISSVSLNRSIGIGGVKFKTGNTTMKTGLQLDAGYGLGSLTLQGGLSASATLDSDGLTFEGTSSDPTLDLELPYAYLGLDAVGEFKFGPSLKFWYDLWLAEGETSNLLSFLNTDVDISRSLIDLDTRDITGSNFTRSFSIGAFSANASIPNFGSVNQLNNIPTAIQNSSDWANGFGDGIAYGVSGSTTLLDLSLSLGQVATYFGLPLTFSKSIWGGDLSVSGTLADASISVDAEMNYSAKVAVKANVYATVEGLTPNKKYDILGGSSSIDPSKFQDTNNDGKISVTVEADPIIAANASVSIEGGVNAGAEVLSAEARLSKWGYNKTWNVGPLWEGGPWDLYSNEVSLIDKTKSFALSDLAPNLQDQLSATIDLPVV